MAKKEYQELSVSPTARVITIECLVPFDESLDEVEDRILAEANSYGTAAVVGRKIITNSESEALAILNSRSI